VPHAPIRFGVVIVVIHTDASFGGWIIIRNHLREVTVGTTDTRGKVVVVANPLYPLPWFTPEVDKLNDLWMRHDTAVLVQPHVHEVELVPNFDDRKDIHII
jgi:hypothetical protein